MSKTRPIVHGSFTIERRYKAPPARVFAAWAELETKARWFVGPPEQWRLLERQLDFRVGGRELLYGELTSGVTTLFAARYHAIVPDERLVYVYDMSLGDKHLSASLASVELSPTAGGGTRMTFTEQAAFLDGEDWTASREAGTAAHFDRLAPVLEDASEIVASRVLNAPRQRVFAAFAEPRELALWWGPEGFSSTFSEFDFRPGGVWRFVMHGPDGTDYPNANDFVEVAPPERVVYLHRQPQHDFRMTMSFLELGAQTLLVWRMRFDSPAAAEPVRARILQANEQNFDRLAAHLASTAPGA